MTEFSNIIIAFVVGVFSSLTAAILYANRALKSSRSIAFGIFKKLLPNELRSLLSKTQDFGLSTLRVSGLSSIYPTWEDAEADIKSSIQEAENLKIISIRGTKWLFDRQSSADAEHSEFLELITERANSGIGVQFLLLKENSPWLETWVKEWNKRTERWNRGNNEPKRKIRDYGDEREDLSKYHASIEPVIRRIDNLERRYYTVYPICRLVMTDKTLFVSPYPLEKPAESAATFRFNPSGEFYESYEQHFKFLWEYGDIDFERLKRDSIAAQSSESAK
ncbi:hypothetical protein HYR99_33335 [Candidatus Poribacteria bacterium]|nr:hypothetical protein [Candidatus Poribacteria bacterium]